MAIETGGHRQSKITIVNRRGFLSLIAASLVPARRSIVRAQGPAASRTYEITTHVHVQRASGVTRAWLPTPLAVAPYQNTLGDTYHVDEGSVTMVEREGLDLLAAEWLDGVDPIVTLTSRVATTQRSVDLATPAVAPPKDFSAFGPFLRPPQSAALDDALVKERAGAVAKGSGTDLDRARAILEAVAKGGHPESQDPPLLYVAIARASGLPSRLVSGLSLAKTDATRAQEARAEVYLVGFGWVPVDVRRRTFGTWDSAWAAFNAAEDLALPGAARGALPYFMHPQAETAGRRVDPLDPGAFRYEITVMNA
jgi:transglutaminase superfamily protein